MKKGNGSEFFGGKKREEENKKRIEKKYRMYETKIEKRKRGMR